LFEQDSQGGVVLTIAGVVEEHEASLVGKKSAGNVLLKITDTPAGKTYLDLMSRMMGQRSDVSGEDSQRLYANTMGGEFAIVPALEVSLLAMTNETSVMLQKEPSLKMFKEKFGEAAKLYDVSIREDRYFVSELLALDSLIAHLDDIPLFANQLIMINLATLDVSPLHHC
jgi:hypothetical protein